MRSFAMGVTSRYAGVVQGEPPLRSILHWRRAAGVRRNYGKGKKRPNMAYEDILLELPKRRRKQHHPVQ